MATATTAPPTISASLPAAEQVSVGLICIAAVVGPLALGCTGPWPRFGLETALAMAGSLWALSRPRGGRMLLLPLIVAALFLLQLVPLPDGVLMTLSPLSAGRWKVAREGLPQAWAPVSVEPAATAAAIRRLFLGLTAIVAVTSLSRTPAYRRWFCMALVISAVLIWAAAFAFPVDPEKRAVMGFFNLHGPIHFWMTPERGPLQTAGCGYLQWVNVGDQRYLADDAIRGDGFGTYIYSNHFANALCLALPALWATWMMLAARWRIPEVVRFLVLTTVMVAALWTTGALATSRAGTASLAFAAVVYLALAAPSRWLRWPAGILAVVGGLALLGFVATCQGPLPGVFEFLPAPIQSKLVSLLVDTRVFAAKVAGRMFLASPLLGTGLGSFGDLYPSLVPGERIMFFAHNEYAQMLAEGGLLGAGLLGAAAVTLGSRFRRFLRERPAADRQADAGVWAALAGVAAHSFFDWGMHAPANALLACIVFGLALSSVPPLRTHAAADQSVWRRRGVGLAFAVACLAVASTLGRDAFTESTLDILRRATTAARVAMLEPDAPPAPPRLRDAIRRGSHAARFDPGDWRLAALLAQANLLLANVSSDEQERRTAATAAESWTRRARSSSAVARGLPEPVPPERT